MDEGNRKETTKQFVDMVGKRKFYDRKVRKEGFTIVISLGKVIPHDWKYARITLLKQTPKQVIIQFDKLLGANNLA